MKEFWDNITSVQPEPSLRLVIGTGVAALLLIAWRPIWKHTRQVASGANWRHWYSPR